MCKICVDWLKYMSDVIFFVFQKMYSVVILHFPQGNCDIIGHFWQYQVYFWHVNSLCSNFFSCKKIVFFHFWGTVLVGKLQVQQMNYVYYMHGNFLPTTLFI